jgi:3-oxoadipate enol-lactonase
VTDPVPLRHRLDGPPDAPVVVLGPSLGTALEMWNAQVPALTDRWRVLRYDLRGHSESATPRGHGGAAVPRGPYTVAGLAGDVLALLDDLGLDRVAYCGISLGGAVGLWLAVHHPERLTGLVLCCTAAQFGDPAGWHERAALVRAAGTEPLVGPATGRWFTASFPSAAPAEVARVLSMLRRTPREGYAACCEALADFDIRARLGEIPVPTLVIAGAEDPATPVEMAQELADGIPCAELVVIPGAAHLANVEQPAAVTAAIRGYLERT